jgi:diadenosine tetraphosphatase ApaH/serine/threonine PP2A family protein phosphatase
MRYLVLTDIHGNLQALEAVIADARVIGFDATLVLGLRPAAIVRGNHDRVAAGLSPSAEFHDQARTAIEWTRRTLSPAALESLAALPEGPADVEAGLMICHGAPFDEDHYIFDARDAWRALTFDVRDGEPPMLCLFGHTHVPAAFATGARRGVEILLPDPDTDDEDRAQFLMWDRTRPTLVNFGAVGQPRDGDPRAAYGIVDLERGRLIFRRVEYDIKTAQERILGAGLPERLALRLDRGA